MVNEKQGQLVLVSNTPQGGHVAVVAGVYAFAVLGIADALKRVDYNEFCVGVFGQMVVGLFQQSAADSE
jgi:hypothetical protein